MEYVSYNNLVRDDLSNNDNLSTYIALGFFDGVHLGHQALFKLCTDKAKSSNSISAAVLLDPHPETIVNNIDNFSLLTTLEEKIKQIKSCGIERIYVLNFSEELKRINGEDFVKEILLEKFHMSAVFVGYNYHFGYQKKGDINLIKLLSEKYNFKYYILEPIRTDDGQIISSTFIKELLKKGDIEKANQLLGYSYQISGRVIHGDKRGGEILSFNTANVEVTGKKLLPQNGVYIALVEIEGNKLPALANIGVKPTFQDKLSNKSNTISLEAHIFNFKKDIYYQNVTVSLLKRLRDEKRFTDARKLAQQIRKDKLSADIFFRKQNNIRL